MKVLCIIFTSTNFASFSLTSQEQSEPSGHAFSKDAFKIIYCFSVWMCMLHVATIPWNIFSHAYAKLVNIPVWVLHTTEYLIYQNFYIPKTRCHVIWHARQAFRKMESLCYSRQVNHEITAICCVQYSAFVVQMGRGKRKVILIWIQ